MHIILALALFVGVHAHFDLKLPGCNNYTSNEIWAPKTVFLPNQGNDAFLDSIMSTHNASWYWDEYFGDAGETTAEIAANNVSGAYANVVKHVNDMYANFKAVAPLNGSSVVLSVGVDSMTFYVLSSTTDCPSKDGRGCTFEIPVNRPSCIKPYDQTYQRCFPCMINYNYYYVESGHPSVNLAFAEPEQINLSKLSIGSKVYRPALPDLSSWPYSM
ncbi:hypothetical protein BDK51DRAFT_44633 [Blyttiomyces helicus]|uniref:Uncharacterized protein n=1 Tax=Blyttiomyces helicus TaxID=388810 RepID=A0A4P9VXH5_9FUNG|nr:hypothetical protein BDK51DRAFT_44633 [Blyttiomyces helicus]|eukprot:RKO84429.1 hypothetical protein BDK51DRAFT_44633 [Blyttiomyces helicus]